MKNSTINTIHSLSLKMQQIAVAVETFAVTSFFGWFALKAEKVWYIDLPESTVASAFRNVIELSHIYKDSYTVSIFVVINIYTYIDSITVSIFVIILVDFDKFWDGQVCLIWVGGFYWL